MMKMFSGDETHKQLLFTRHTVQYKSKPYYHLDDVSGLPEHVVNLVGCHADSALSCEAILNKGYC